MEQAIQPVNLMFRVKKVSQMLDLPSSSTYNLINRGELHAVRIGKALRAPAKSLDEFMKRKIEQGLSL